MRRVTPSKPAPASHDFWDGSAALMIMTLAGLLVPLGYILDQRSYMGAGNEQAFGVATAVMALALAGMVQILERALRRRPTVPNRIVDSQGERS